ncbi:DCC1-like thiol-disulfide oxidoreductase family protein [Streptomyces polygonati]|uniref:DCC1-like thiol-disulfide oxidoreductase family protein n=1 Tax=Streptomyces polygonati TaxID=1617087 RepID=A0ABV8HRC8_9ACTN
MGAEVPPGAAPTARPARQLDAGPRLRRLTVLYDPDCRVCAFASGWLARQRQLVPLDLVPVGSPEAVRRFPALDQRAARKEITVIGDGGQVYRGDSAWIVCLWALAEHRTLSHTLTSPAGRRLARAAVLGAAKYREAHPPQRRWEKQPARAGGPPKGSGGARGRQPARGAPWSGAPRPPESTPAPRWVYEGSAGWRQLDPNPPPPPGWTYDPATGWTQPATAPPPEACTDDCSPPG